MTEAPERIWAWAFLPQSQGDEMTGGWHKCSQEIGLEYVRADKVQALVDALREALRVIKDCTDYQHDGDPWTENAYEMRELEIHDFVTDGRFEKSDALAVLTDGESA